MSELTHKLPQNLPGPYYVDDTYAIVEEIPGAISEGETIQEARRNLADALRMILECNRELTRESEPAESRRETMELTAL